MKLTTKRDGLKYRVTGRTAAGLEFSVETEDEDMASLVTGCLDLQKTATAIESLISLRSFCDEIEPGLFIPKRETPNQMMRLCLSASASYPKSLPAIFIETHLGIPYNSYKVYVTSKDRESSRYLSMDTERGVRISVEGVSWTNREMTS